MIEVFLYSIAGKKTDQTIDDLVQEFAASEYVKYLKCTECKHPYHKECKT